MASDSRVPDQQSLRILLVEDHEAAARALARVLQGRGHEVTLAMTGSVALKTLDQELSFDVVLTDWQLPDIDGRQVAARVRCLDPRPRVLLLTGWDFDLLPEVLSDWGVDGVLAKPIDLEQLISVLDETADS